MTEPAASLRILQIVDEPWDSGLTDYALSLSKGLRDAGHQVHIAVRPGKAPEEKARQAGLETWSFSSFGTLWKKIRQGNYSLVNAHTGTGHTMAWLATRGTRTALIRTRGDARPVRRTPFWRPLYRGTSHIIACSEVIRKDYLRCLGLSPEKIITVYPCVEAPAQFPAVPEGPLRIGMAARLDPVKGHEDFLQAAVLLKRRFPEARFVLAGGEANLKIADLKNRARKLGLEDSCSFLGHRTDVPEIMRGCHIGVIASIGSEAVSRAALEWMAAGRPVIATKVGCLPELAQEGLTGRLIEPTMPNQMAEALIQLANDADLRLRQGKAGWERARQEFDMERLVSATVRVYREALSNLP